jgi:hypothetical protein
MPTATTNLHWWFFTVFEEKYESLGEDEYNVKQEMRDIVGAEEEDKIYTNSILLKEWCEDKLTDYDDVQNQYLLRAIINTVDWVKLCQDLREWVKDYDEQEAEKDRKEEEEEQKKIEAKQKEVEQKLKDLKQKCDCCDIIYPYDKVWHNGRGDYLCESCENEYPDCHDYKTAHTCPALLKIIDTLASNSSSSSSSS